MADRGVGGSVRKLDKLVVLVGEILIDKRKQTAHQIIGPSSFGVVLGIIQ